MKLKTKYFVLLMLLVTLSIITIIILKDNKQEIKLDNVSLKESVSNSFALMLEQTNGTYEETTDTEWPSEGYSFNKHMSGCIDSNGNTIENTLTYKNGTIKLKTKHNTYCYIYFDIDRPATEELLATVPEEQLWESTLEDDGYRYVGTNPNNYICFGTTDQKECMNDTDKYMYRIIGIFEDEEGNKHLKLIKKEALNAAYAWNVDYQNDVDWDESDLYKGLNGSYFATNNEYSYMQDSAWNNLITTWGYTATNTKTHENYLIDGLAGLDYYSQNTKIIYSHEMNRSSKTSSIGEWKPVSVKVGVMYVSDYQLSLGSVALDYTNSNSTHYQLMKNGWLHLSNNDKSILNMPATTPPSTHEWTMSRYGFNSTENYIAYGVGSGGDINGWFVNNTLSVRPVFYLESDTKLDKGTGTIDDPYTIEISPNLKEYCEEYNNINECIKNEENNIEEVKDLWNSTLEDDGIRYVGTNPNNYVCFGTTNKEECTSDTDKYMYRIIGIFEDGEGNQHLKLIKKEALNTAYKWHNDNTTDKNWEESNLYKGITENYFLTNTTYSYLQDTTWADKIEEWNYIVTNTLTYENYLANSVPGPNYHYQIIKTTYLHEKNKSSKINEICYNHSSLIADCTVGKWNSITSKVGLMYVSDYQLSLGSFVTNYTNNNSIHYQAMKTGWMHISNNDSGAPSSNEWTMSRYGEVCYENNVCGYRNAWAVYVDGYVHWYSILDNYSVRPVFYLTENIKITSGKGSITEPFIIS